MGDSHLVFSTEQGGRVEAAPEQASAPQGDGVVRIHRQTKGKKGKGVSVVTGLGLSAADLKTLAQELKKKCGCGGTVKEWDVEIQTDDRAKLKTLLEQKGYQVKIAGG